MSDILIRNIDMPKNCLICPCFQFDMVDDTIDGYCNVLKIKIIDSGERHPDCPLVEVPTPHGDLVDLSDTVHPNDSMRRMTIDEQLRRTCEGWDRKQYVVIGAEREIII